MKNELENIDQVFKQTFDGFEANVDPNIWGNIQAGLPQTATTVTVANTLKLKLIASIIAVGVVGTGIYYALNNTSEKNIENTIEEIAYRNDDSEKTILNKISLPEKEVTVISVEENKRSLKENKNAVKPTFLKTKAVKTNNDIPNIEKNITPNNGAPAPTNSHYESNNKENPISPQTKNDINKEITTTTVVNNSNEKENVDFHAVINTSVTSGIAPLYVQFSVEGERIVSYNWDFVDNTEFETEKEVYHTFENPGIYLVELNVIDENNNSKIVVEKIVVEKEGSSYLAKIPNAFSPNGDNLNDVYKISGENIIKFNAIIMAHNGNTIYQWHSIDGFWDGTDMAGNKLAYGTYYLVLQAIGLDGKKYTKKTVVHVLPIEQ